jgi:glucose-6-phosphate isomerase
MLNSIKLKKTMFCVITKSGTTSETLAQMMIVINRLKSKKLDISKHLTIITTRDNDLWNFASENNIKSFDIPKGVGGRFSILSSVGLLPASVMGIDIRALLSGARKSLENSQHSEVGNLAYTSAYINYTYLNKGLTNLVMMPYSDRLALVPDFFAQLWAESLGKKTTRDGEIVYTGQTPIKTIGVTDQHSQLQLYSEGIKDKLIMFVTVAKSDLDEKVTGDLPFAKHLNGTTLKTLLDYEYDSTAYSLTTIDRPNYTVAIDSITEENIGEFIFYMEMMTAFMGEMLNIDAYDQPGVELSKIYTKACLKLKGYEEEGKKIYKFSRDKKHFFI